MLKMKRTYTRTITKNITNPINICNHTWLVACRQCDRKHCACNKYITKIAHVPHHENCTNWGAELKKTAASVDAWHMFVWAEAAGSPVFIGFRLPSESSETEGYFAFAGVSPPLLYLVDLCLNSGVGAPLTSRDEWALRWRWCSRSRARWRFKRTSCSLSMAGKETVVRDAVLSSQVLVLNLLAAPSPDLFWYFERDAKQRHETTVRAPKVLRTESIVSLNEQRFEGVKCHLSALRHKVQKSATFSTNTV